MDDEGSLKLGTKAFQQATNRAAHTKSVKESVRALMDSQTGFVREELVEDRDCPGCSARADAARVIFVKDGFRYRKCERCTLVYVSPMLTAESIANMYRNSAYASGWMNVLLNPTEQEFNRPKFERGIDQIEEHLGRKGRLLEIGCAIGQFLTISCDRGWDVTGLELNDEERAHSQSLGLEVVGEPITPDLFPQGSFDAVAMWEVLEHVTDPSDVVRSVRHLLKDDGVFLIAVPNVDALAAQVLQEKCNMFHGPSHLTMFSPNTLREFLSHRGFAIEHMSTFISEINVLDNYLQYQDPYLGDTTVRHPLFDVLDEETIHRNLLGYKLKTIARKQP